MSRVLIMDATTGKIEGAVLHQTALRLLQAEEKCLDLIELLCGQVLFAYHKIDAPCVPETHACIEVRIQLEKQNPINYLPSEFL